MKALYIIWQDPESRAWHPVARLRKHQDVYEFVYTQGAKRSANFRPFGRLSDVNRVYMSEELFPLFANRLLPKSRPEYVEFVNWLGFTKEHADPLDILALTGGIRQTDPLAIYAPPQRENGRYEISFFCHGIRHLASPSQEVVNKLSVGDRLYLMLDAQNEFDRLAVALRTGDPATLIGYAPRYLAHDFTQLVAIHGEVAQPVLTVERVNVTAPLQLRLMCHLTANWPEGFEPCGAADFQPIAAADLAFFVHG